MLRNEKNIFNNVNLRSAKIKVEQGKYEAYDYVDSVIKDLENDLDVSITLITKLKRLRDLYIVKGQWR